MRRFVSALFGLALLSSTALSQSVSIVTNIPTGTSGHAIPYLDGTNTWSAVNTFTGQIIAGCGNSGTPAILFGAGGPGLYCSGSVLVDTSAFTAGGTVTGTNLAASVGGAIFWTGRSEIRSDADGNVTLFNSADTDFGLLKFGGTTSAFPALKRSSTGLVARLADDSANAPLTSSTLTASGLSNIATTSAVCYNTSTGVISYDGTIGTCTVSSARFKEGFASISDRQALDMTLAMQPKSWRYKGEMQERIGFVAEDLADIDHRLVGYGPDGLPRNDDYFAVITIQAGALRALKADNDELKACQASWKCRIFGFR